ncbi:hypothetical protein BsWGS_17762 [Bradybaena similaris]
MAGCLKCLGQTPFASLVAALLVLAGTGAFCGTSFISLQLIIDGVLKELFGFTVNWLEILQKMFIVIGGVMAVFAIILLIFGFLATGATRSNIYSGAKCIMGGRITAVFFMVLSYLLTIGWLALFSVCVIPVLVYVAVTAICTNEIYSRSNDELMSMNYCFNLTRFGLYNLDAGSGHVCGSSRLRSMCNKVAEAGPLFCVAFGATALVVLGMIHFLVTLAANYTRIKISKELTEYRDAIETEELDLHSSEKKGPPPYREESSV